MEFFTLEHLESLGDSIPSADDNNIAFFQGGCTAPCHCSAKLDYWRSGTAKRVRIIITHGVQCIDKKPPKTRQVDGFTRS